MVSDRRSRHARRRAQNGIWPGNRCSQVAEGTQIMGALVDCSLDRGHTGEHYSCDHGVYWSRTDTTMTITGQQLSSRSHAGTAMWIGSQIDACEMPKYTWDGATYIADSSGSMRSGGDLLGTYPKVNDYRRKLMDDMREHDHKLSEAKIAQDIERWFADSSEARKLTGTAYQGAQWAVHRVLTVLRSSE